MIHPTRRSPNHGVGGALDQVVAVAFQCPDTGASWDYFVRHLMGEAPPACRIADVPVDPEVLAAYLGG